MPYAKRPAFEQYRSVLIGKGKPLPEREIVPIQAAVVAHLDTIPGILIQKTRRQGHRESLIEISGSWVGLDVDHRDVVAALRRFWPGRLFADVDELYTVSEVEENVVMTFAASYPNERYLTGRLLVTF